MSKKSIIAMVISMLLIILIYFILSGSLTINSSIKDVFSIEESEAIIENDEQWSFMIPDKEEYTKYFTYNGEKHPRKSVALRAVFYTDKDGIIEEEQIDVYLVNDNHFFVGEKRWYLPENVENITAAYCKIAYRETASGDIYYDYLYTNNLSEDQMKTAKDWIDSANMEENMLSK